MRVRRSYMAIALISCDEVMTCDSLALPWLCQTNNMAAKTKEKNECDNLIFPSLTNICPNKNRTSVHGVSSGFGAGVMFPVLDPTRSSSVFYGVRKTSKYVSEWYISWRPWQRELLLCSLSAKCSISQLSSLSTILEPVFHRDFVLRLRGKYPLCDPQKDSKTVYDSDDESTSDVESLSEGSPKSTPPGWDISSKRSVPQAPMIEVTNTRGSQTDNSRDVDQRPRSALWSLTSVMRQNLSRQSMVSATGTLSTTEQLISSPTNTGESPGLLVDKYCHAHTAKVSTTPKKKEFFANTRLPMPDNMKASVRQNKAKVHRQFSDMDAKCYKHAKWWGSQNSKELVSARGAKLWKVFSKQLQEINEIMDNWDDHDRAVLLSELIKSSDPAQMTFFAQCLIQRLRDRTDFRILPDRIMLKIFSTFDVPTLCKLSKVSKRWRFIANDQNLWKNKCSQLGWSKGIKNVALLIERLGYNYSVDWKQAYREIYEIFREKDALMKSTELGEDTNEEKVQDDWRLRQKRRNLMLKILKERSESERHGTSTSLQDTADVADKSTTGEMAQKTSLPTVVDNIISMTEDVELIAKVEEHRSEDVLDAADLTGGSMDLLEDDIFELTEVIVGRRENLDELALDVRPLKIQANNELEKNDTEDYEQVTVAVEDVKSVKRVRKIQGHMESIFCLQFDARRCLTGSADRILRMWDVRSGKGIRRMYGHTGGIRCVQFDNQKIVSGSWDTTIMIWDIVKFTCIGVLHGHEGCVSCLKFNSKYIISCSHDKTIRIWDVNTWRCLRVIRGHEGEVTSLFVSGSIMLTGSTDKTIKMWDIQRGRCLKTFVGHESTVLSIQASRALVISGSEDGKIMFWNLENGKQVVVIQGHDGPCHCLVIWKSHFLSGGGDHIVKEWDIGTLTCLRTLQGHKGAVYCVKRNALRILSSSEDGTVRIWDLEVPVQKIARNVEGEDKTLLPLSTLEHSEGSGNITRDTKALWRKLAAKK